MYVRWWGLSASEELNICVTNSSQKQAEGRRDKDCHARGSAVYPEWRAKGIQEGRPYTLGMLTGAEHAAAFYLTSAAIIRRVPFAHSVGSKSPPLFLEARNYFSHFQAGRFKGTKETPCIPNTTRHTNGKET